MTQTGMWNLSTRTLNSVFTSESFEVNTRFRLDLIPFGKGSVVRGWDTRNQMVDSEMPFRFSHGSRLSPKPKFDPVNHGAWSFFHLPRIFLSRCRVRDLSLQRAMWCAEMRIFFIILKFLFCVEKSMNKYSCNFSTRPQEWLDRTRFQILFSDSLRI